MPEPAQIFRKESLERLSTPDRLDQLMRVVKRRSWLVLLTLGGLLAAALVWCVVGRIPLTAEAGAVIVHPRQVVPLQAAAAGELLELGIHVGETVELGQVIGRLNLPGLTKQLELEESRLLQFREKTAALAGFNREQAQQEKDHLESQRQKIEARILNLKDTAQALRVRGEAFNAEQRTNLETTRESSTELGKALKGRLDSYEKLLQEGLTSEDAVVSARQQWVANRLTLAQIEVQLQELRLREIQTQESYDRQMDLVTDLTIQLEQIQVKVHETGRRLEEARILDETSEADIVRTVDGLRAGLHTQSRIVAPYAGTVLEVTVSVGSMVSPGQRIASLAVRDPDQTLVAIAYFDVGRGKKIEPGMSARVSPVTVQKQRYGSMLARVARVSAYPVTVDAVVNEVGNRELAAMLVGDQSRIEVVLAFDPDASAPSGYAWTSAGGPALRITPGTTAAVNVTIEERAPITLLLPALRGWFSPD